jgi:hypothetical protein
VPEEPRQRKRGQEIGREDSYGSGHVVVDAAELERVHASEIGHDVSQSVYLDAGVDLLVE